MTGEPGPPIAALVLRAAELAAWLTLVARRVISYWAEVSYSFSLG